MQKKVFFGALLRAPFKKHLYSDILNTETRSPRSYKLWVMPENRRALSGLLGQNKEVLPSSEAQADKNGGDPVPESYPPKCLLWKPFVPSEGNFFHIYIFYSFCQIKIMALYWWICSTRICLKVVR